MNNKAKKISLHFRDWNEVAEPRTVTFDGIRNLPVGTVLSANPGSACGRDRHEDVVRIVARLRDRVIVRFHTEGTTDEPNPRPWHMSGHVIHVVR